MEDSALKTWYIATPYSKHAKGLEYAYIVAAEYCDMMRDNGYKAMSPIAIFHGTAKQFNLPTHAQFWMSINDALADACFGLIMVTDEGWMESVGMRHEFSVFTSARKPVLFAKPWEMPSGIELYGR